MQPNVVGALVGITFLAIGAFEAADAALCMCHPSSCLLINPDNAALSNAELHCPANRRNISDLMIVRYIDTNFSSDVFAHFPNLTSLELFQGSLSHIEPGAFEKMPTLTKIIIRNNQLAALEDHTFRGLTGLEVLYIISSGLSTIASSALEGLKHLTHLTLSANKLTHLPEKLFASTPALRSISLAANKISDLPAGLFDNMNDLSRLDLSNNRLTSFDFPQLKLTLLMLHNNSLTSLYLSDHYTAVQADQNRIASLTGTGANLTDLVLSENEISDINTIARLFNLTKLSLASNPLLPNTVFNTLPRLEELLLSHTNIQITEQTFANLSELKLLDLSYNNMTQLEFSMFRSLIELRTLVVAFNRIEKINFIEQREYLPQLRVMEICGNGWNATYLESVLDHMHRYKLKADMQGLSHTYLFSSTYVELCSAASEGSKKGTSEDDYYEDISDILEHDIVDLFPSTTTRASRSQDTTTTTTEAPTTPKMAPVSTSGPPAPSAQPSVRLVTPETETIGRVKPLPPAELKPKGGSSPLHIAIQVSEGILAIIGLGCTILFAYKVFQRRYRLRRVSSIDRPDSVRLV